MQCVNYSANGVGNRPHYPMFVLSNTSTDFDMLCQFRKNAELVWPQSASNLVYASYNLKDGKIYDICGEEATTDELSQKLDDVKCNHDAFAEMKKWCVYNVVDTSFVDDIVEFEAAYNYINVIKDIVVDTTVSMLVVILDDSTRMRKHADIIKHFLANENSKVYDGMIIVSNRTMDNAMQSKDEIYRIVSNVFTLSNNDAVGGFDNEDYSARNAILYSNRINTVSYTRLEQPMMEKAVQMIEIVLSEALKRFDKKSAPIDKQQWKDYFGISNGKIKMCEKYISSTDLTVDLSALLHIPLSRIDTAYDDFGKMSYAKLKDCTFDGILERFVENYYTKELENNFPLKLFEEDYIKFISENIPSNCMLELDNNTLNEIYNELCAHNINNSTTIEDFIVNEICCNIRKKVYLRFRTIISNMIKDAQRIKDTIVELHTAAQKEKPLIEPEFIGDIHKNLTYSYLQGAKGDSDIKSVMSTSNKMADIQIALERTIKSIITTHIDDFAKNFATMWISIFGTSTEGTTKLRQALDGDYKRRISLNGVFSVDNVLSVYMFHTVDITGQQKTPLLDLMQQAYIVDNKIQFFNTGTDDSIEVMKFVDCGGNKLEL